MKLSYKFFIICAFALNLFNGNAQELEPRFLSSVPIKTNIAALVYGYSTGNILLDNALPIKGLNANMHSVALVYVRSFKLFNKLAKFDATAPYSTSIFNGLLFDEEASTTRNGFGDPTFRVSMILVGDEPLTPIEFSKRKFQKFKLGVAFKTRVPIGQYDNSKLINLGTNRWGFQFKTAAAYRISPKIIIEGHISSWFFTENSRFYSYKSLKQEPLLGAQINAAYIFNPSMWLSGAIGVVNNGRTTVDGNKQNNVQDNSRFSATFSTKLNKKSALKFIVTNEISTNVGSNFTSYIVGYTYIWFD
ncbi:MAG: transporter [Flavobacteriaceae bacterium]|nr:transporter [Flavobacteriaceae bacterium]